MRAHAETDTNLWGESYERDMRQVLALQGEVARAIARAVRVKLAPQQEARLITAREVRVVVPKARAEAERALELDGRLAEAHAALAGIRAPCLKVTLFPIILVDPQRVKKENQTDA